MMLTDVCMDTYRARQEPVGPWGRTDDVGIGWWYKGQDNMGLCGGHSDGTRDTNVVNGRARRRHTAGTNRVARTDSHVTGGQQAAGMREDQNGGMGADE